MRNWLLIGDLLANLSFGALAGVTGVLVVAPGGNMWGDMLLAMAAGMLVGTIGSVLLLPLLGAMEVMLPVMLSGMLAGMVTGMMESHQAVALWDSALWGATMGLTSLLFCSALNGVLNGEVEQWTN